MMVLLRILNLSGVERGAMVRSILFRILESMAAALPVGLACLVVMALMQDQRVVPWLPYSLDTMPAVMSVAAVFAVLYGLQWVLSHLGSLYGYGAGLNMTANLRIRIAKKLPTLPLSWFNKHDSGELAHIVMQDMVTIEQVPGLVIPRLVTAMTLPVVALSALMFLDIRMGMALFFGIGLSIPVLILGHRTLRRATQRYVQSQSAMNARLIEFIRGIAVIKSFGLASDSETRCYQAIGSFRDRSQDLTWSFVRPMIAFPSVLMLGCILVLAGGAYFVVAGTLELAAWPVFFLVSLRLLGPLANLMEFSALVRQMEAAMERIMLILDAPSDEVTGDYYPIDCADIVFRNVSFSYADKLCQAGPDTAGHVVDLDFTIPTNTVTAIVGLTGSGKSTLVRLLARQYQPACGQIMIGGVDLAVIPDQQLHGLVSVVSQTVTLFTETVADSIRAGRLDACDDDVVKAARAARCHDFIMRLPDGYNTVLAGAGAALSGGERQRIALARAFLQDSPILVLDEVTSALDIENERLIQEALGDLVHNRTVLVIAHRLWTIRNAHQILVMDHGRIVERGSHSELIGGGGLYNNLWSALASAPGWHGSGAKAA
ncbi:ABC transporter ATP-binding protein [Haematospirillum sp. 15-248]|uniref:ABC transporter ATP-binding protein n=1 Tax=Haematospirillum sp. 15-248 TaxID=2723107 RepID=UPI00143BE82A|nr:ABC transporter ATP-binding protein [Haematospirillum sp. 15-248]NKD88685.1 ABC transporter ATP-binding protein [Haematospirillum sp. 15-248]